MISNAPSRLQIVAEARSWLGTPYIHQATTKSVQADGRIPHHQDPHSVQEPLPVPHEPTRNPFQNQEAPSVGTRQG